MKLSDMEQDKDEYFNQFIGYITPMIDGETKTMWLDKMHKKQKRSETDVTGSDHCDGDQFKNEVSKWFMNK